MRKVMVTGNAGLIGPVAVSRFFAETDVVVVTIDKLTYADNLDSVPGLTRHPPQTFEHVDLCDVRRTARVFAQHKPDGVVHLAAESHVDRSIHGPQDVIETRILGTDTLLGAARSDWRGPSLERSAGFRFHHLSTGDVHGSVGDVSHFTEERPHVPHSMCSASMATSGHLVRAWYPTSGIPAVAANCPNNYAPNGLPEKLIPPMILSALEGKALPIYGNRDDVRDGLYVDDRVRALRLVLATGQPGEPCKIDGHNEHTDLQVATRSAHGCTSWHRAALASCGAIPLCLSSAGSRQALCHRRRQARVRSRRDAAADIRDRPAQIRAVVPGQPRLM